MGGSIISRPENPPVNSEIVHSVRFEASVIEVGLLLGGIHDAESAEFLERFGVTHILSIYSRPISKKAENVKCEFIKAADNENEDLLSRFDEAFQIISKSQQDSGVILVHCQRGISRSATIVIAYLMKKYRQSYDSALRKVRSARAMVYPNAGFVRQLRLYEQLEYSVDLLHPLYKEFKKQLAATPFAKIGPDDDFVRQFDEWTENYNLF